MKLLFLPANCCFLADFTPALITYVYSHPSVAYSARVHIFFQAPRWLSLPSPHSLVDGINKKEKKVLKKQTKVVIPYLVTHGSSENNKNLLQGNNC